MRVLVMFSHPVPTSFGAAVRDRALAGLHDAGHDVRLTDLYDEGFDAAMTLQEWRSHAEPGAPQELQRYADDLAWAEVLVLIYPTWWSGLPSMLKGWIDRVWVSGVAWDPPGRLGSIRPRLRNIRRIVAVTTHGSSKLANSLGGESGKRTITRSIRAMCARRCRTTWCALYGLDQADEAKRTAFLARVEQTMATL